MLLLIAITALLCRLGIQADQTLQAFYPQNIGETSCAGGAFSWTKWFNEAKPSDNGNLDKEVLSVIQKLNSGHVCAQPLAIHIQSVGVLPPIDSFQLSMTILNNAIAGFQSNTPGIDFQVRFCCRNTDFKTTIATTKTTTPTTTATPRPLPSGKCGQAEIKNSFSRIFGGSHAIPNSWPWQVLYEEYVPCGQNQVCTSGCGGTLIDDRHVLTAAHCIGGTNPALITITAGLHNKNSNEANTRQVRTVERIFKHPGYNAEGKNDIAILRLAQPVQFNKYVQPACLPGPEPQPDEDVVLIGWGALQSGGQSYPILKQAQVKVVGQCNRYWGAQVDDAKQVCVANVVTGESACQGDSGGPMLYERNGQWIVAGVTSFGSPFGCVTYANFPPNVYTRVSAYLPWIQSIV